MSAGEVSAAAATAAGARRRGLLKVLGVGFGVAVTVGNTIGAGILRTPGEVAERLPSLPLFFGAWIIGAVYAALGAVSLAELGAMLPRSGGQYNFARHAFGRYAGFVVGWTDWLSTAGSTAAIAIVVGEYSGQLVPALDGREVSLAAAVIVLFTLIQWRGIRWGDRTQALTSVLKVIVLLALVVACFVLPAVSARPAETVVSVPAGSALLLALVLALQSVIYTYDGWTGIIYFSEEVRDPGRDIPRSMVGSVVMIAGIYLLLNAAFVYVRPLSSLAGDPFPAGSVAAAIFGPLGDVIIRVIVIVSMLSAINALVLMAPRVLYAMSRDGLFSTRGADVNAGGTPTTALVASAVVSLAFLASGTFNSVIAVLSFFFVANYVISFSALFALRRREPEAPRPYRAWGYPWTTGIALVGSLAFLAGAVVLDPRSSAYALLVLALTAPVYLIARRFYPARDA